jgi:hypothetical protein
MEDLDVHKRIILKWVLKEIGWEGVDWIQMVQDRDQWRTLVNIVINILAQ